jgi:hypothetical protein
LGIKLNEYCLLLGDDVMFENINELKENGIFDDIIKDLIDLDIALCAVIIKIELDEYKIIETFNTSILNITKICFLYKDCHNSTKYKNESWRIK